MASADGNAVPPTEQKEAAPSLCSSGCGFFGNPSTGGMCSKCYKETIAKTAASSTPKPSTPVTSAPAVASATPPASSSAATPAAVTEAKADSPAAAPACVAIEPTVEPAASASSGQVRPPQENEDEEPPKKVQVNTSRCWTCNRKIGLLGFQCKCQFYFCSEHRYSDRHECVFDYKAQGKQLLTKANPTIAPAKMESM